MWHLLVAHQQECFLPFSSRESLSCCLSHVAKANTPKSRDPNLLHQSCVILSLLPQKPHGPSSGTAATTRFKSQSQSSSAAPFPTPPTISYTCQHSHILPLFWAAIVSLGRHGPMAWSQSSPSSHVSAVTRGSCFPVTFWVKVTSIPLAQSMATAI